MTSRDRVKVAVIGAGAWAPRHVEAIRRTGMGDVAALVGRDPVKVRVAASRLAVEQSSVNVREVLEDPTIEVIHICTPNESHARLAQAAIAAGKHVVVEKPIALSAEEARGLAEAAGSSRVHGMTAFTYRGFSTLRRFRVRVQEGELGDIRIAAGHFLQDWLTRPSGSWRLDPIQGGPSLTVADIGVHWFDAVEYASTQRVEQVVGDLAINRPDPQGGEDTACVLLRFANGATGTLLLSQAFSGQKNAMRIDLAGDRGSLTWELGPEEKAVDALTNLFIPYYRSVLRRQPPLPDEGMDYPTLSDGHRAAQFVDAVLASSQTQTWASLERKVSDDTLWGAET
jgi:predicted dehydrogenase